MSLRSGIRRFPALAALLFPCAIAAQTLEIVHSFGPGGTASPIGAFVRLADGTLVCVSQASGKLSQGALFALVPDGVGGFSSSVTLHEFGGFDGFDPVAGVILGADGYLYGTTLFGGIVEGASGTVFRMAPSGHFTMIHSFTYAEGDVPSASLIEAPAGSFWGAASDGGTLGHGSVFRIDSAGSLTILHSFTFDDGASPRSRLTLASDGNFYGTTQQGGANGLGTIFRISPDGTFATIYDFNRVDGGSASSLTEGSSGLLYGLAPFGGASSQGAIFTIDPAGTFTIVHDFDGTTDGSQPQSNLVRSSDGGFVGTTASGGPGGGGTVFHASAAGTVTTRHAFSYAGGGSNPDTEIVEAPGGALFGGTSGGGSLGGGTVFRIDPDDTFTTVWEFPDNQPLNPQSGLVRASDGNLYGTTMYASQSTGGTVYRLDPDDQVVVLRYLSQEEGVGLSGTLLEGPDGDLYGTAGGSGPNGLGTLFKITTAGEFTLLHSFSLLDSGLPSGGLTDGGDGFLYGVERGTGQSGGLYGEAFQIDTDGNFHSVHVFDGTDGTGPSAPPIRASNGALYGTTEAGGANPSYGTVYRIDSGTLTTIHDFARTDGGEPGAILQATDGKLYGICLIGGVHDQGTIFDVDAVDTVSTLYDFFNVALPTSILQGSDGSLYGTTVSGGVGGSGTVFRVGLNGNPATLHSFMSVDGAQPYGRPLEGPDGSFLGTTLFGGLSNSGVIYRILPTAAAPTIESVQPSAGRPAGGTTFAIHGSHFQPLPTVALGGVALALPSEEIDSRTIRAMAPGVFAPGTLHDVTVTNADMSSATLPNAWFADFRDVDSADVFHDSVESIVRAGITVGCGAGNYCGTSSVTRAQMAVFLLKAKHGSSYTPPSCRGLFADVPCPGGFAVDWIEELAGEQITGGCGGGDFCPNDAVRRDQMAVLLLKASQGSDYVPPPASGTLFADVPTSAFAADWIEDLYARSITAGCLTSPLRYCPSNANNRQQMAVLITNAFGLP